MRARAAMVATAAAWMLALWGDGTQPLLRLSGQACTGWGSRPVMCAKHATPDRWPRPTEVLEVRR